jgi:hypothetical protein
LTAVAVLFATVRRTTPDRAQGTTAGIVAGAVLAFTPAAALMFRFNNPDAFLVLLLVIAAYCLTRAVATASWRWLALVGAVMGAAFLTKMLRALSGHDTGRIADLPPRATGNDPPVASLLTAGRPGYSRPCPVHRRTQPRSTRRSPFRTSQEPTPPQVACQDGPI